MKIDLRTVIANLEAATEGSRKLDGEIALQYGWTVVEHDDWVEWVPPLGTPKGALTRHFMTPQRYTTSLDAALTLCDGYDLFLVDRFDGVLGPHAMLFAPSSPAASDITVVGSAHLKTEDPRSHRAFVVCLAALRAKLKRETDEPEQVIGLEYDAIHPEPYGTQEDEP